MATINIRITSTTTITYFHLESRPDDFLAEGDSVDAVFEVAAGFPAAVVVVAGASPGKADEAQNPLYQL